MKRRKTITVFSHNGVALHSFSSWEKGKAYVDSTYTNLKHGEIHKGEVSIVRWQHFWSDTSMIKLGGIGILVMDLTELLVDAQS